MITIQEIRENNYSTVGVEIKSYLPFATKKTIIQKIIDVCVIDENDIKTIDYAVKEMIYEYLLVNNYTNIDFANEDIITIYDELEEKKFINAIIEKIDIDEKNLIEYILRKELDQTMEIQNSVGVQLNKIATKLMAKIPSDKEMSKLLKSVSKEFKNFDPSKLNFISDAMKTFNGDNQ
jgi:hypothetical protein